MTLEQLAVDHPYYCSDSNYYSRDAAMEYETWENFYEEWKDADEDYNYMFRWDIQLKDSENPSEGYSMSMFYILQRKGIYKPIIVETVKEENVPEILEHLSRYAQYTKKLWEPIVIR